MAEPIPNGVAPTSGDVEMKEELATEVKTGSTARAVYENGQLMLSQAPLSSIQQADPTDPNPPPQNQPLTTAEHLSTIQPAAQSTATPPAPSALSTRPGSLPPQPSAKPEKPVAHGGPTRQYLNHNVTPHLLEGMKYLAVYAPEKPLQWLSDFLRDRSKEVEG